eukprot:GHVH01006562.1.p1 GENE.GHVH01006562.1~~GHVH01006562.1.p1  ORF type:complete len:357 (+),score=77.07 GHVH01006562.1:115-1185(+)
MKVVLRTIKNKEHEVECTEDELVEKLLEACVSGFEQDFTRDALLLVYKGKVMDSVKSIGTYGLKDGDRVVVMSKKKKDIGKVREVPKPKPELTKKKEPVEESEISVAPVAAADDASPLIPVGELSDETQAALTTMEGMGFDRTECIKVLQLADNNVDRATSLLLESAAEDEDLTALEAEDGLKSVVDSLRSQSDGSAVEEYTVDPDHPLYDLTSSEAFEEMRVHVRRDPSTLPQFIAEIFNANPELVEIVLQHEMEFLKCLLGPTVPGNLLQMAQAGQAGPQPSEDEMRNYAERMAAAQQMNRNVVAEIESAFSEDDKASITRLMELGFGKERVVEAFVACDKNEEAAANFLFDEF